MVLDAPKFAEDQVPAILEGIVYLDREITPGVVVRWSLLVLGVDIWHGNDLGACGGDDVLVLCARLLRGHVRGGGKEGGSVRRAQTRRAVSTDLLPVPIASDPGSYLPAASQSQRSDCAGTCRDTSYGPIQTRVWLCARNAEFIGVIPTSVESTAAPLLADATAAVSATTHVQRFALAVD